MKIKIPKHAMQCDPLGEERHELLSTIADDDAHLRQRKYLPKLIFHRLKEIEEQMKALGCPPDPDAGEFAAIINELDDLSHGDVSDE